MVRRWKVATSFARPLPDGRGSLGAICANCDRLLFGIEAVRNSQVGFTFGLRSLTVAALSCGLEFTRVCLRSFLLFMPTFYDIAWTLLIGLGAPVVAVLSKPRRKVLKAFRERMGRDIPAAPLGAGPCVMIHAVSLGEMNATPALVAQLSAARPNLRFLITVTTDTGHARGVELYGKNAAVTLVRYPLDLSSSIKRLLDRQRPSVVVLMELEVWPNFMLHCERRKIPVLLVNGRLTAASFKNYRRARWMVRPMFRRLSDVCAQDAIYAERFCELGASPNRVRVTGTMKFDTAQMTDRIDGDEELAHAVGLRRRDERIWVCGSTGPGEERVALDAYRTLLPNFPALRLVLVPRHPQRFDEVAALIAEQGFPVVRRSSGERPTTAELGTPPPVVLGDTMGELRKFYSLADVVFVGRSLVDLGARQRGSDMIEPAALAKPVVIGPWTQNFADAVRQLQNADAVRVIAKPTELATAIDLLLRDPAKANEMGQRARGVVAAQQGATARHVELILKRVNP